MLSPRAARGSSYARGIARLLVAVLLFALVPFDASAATTSPALAQPELPKFEPPPVPAAGEVLYCVVVVGEANILTKSAFGELLAHTGSAPQPYAFTGEPLDPNSGWQYHRARWMDPSTGRFAGMDPWEADADDPSTLARYPYAGASPTDNVDSTGFFSVSVALTGLVVMVTLLGIATPTYGGATKGVKHKPRIVVCQKEKKLTFYDVMGNPALKADVVCGCQGTPTPNGKFKAGEWQKDKVNRKFSGPKGWSKSKWKNPYGPWFLPVENTGGCGIHGTIGWKFLNDLFIDIPGTCSHGCMRLSNNNITKLHDLLPKPKGTEVNIKATCEEAK